MICQEDFEIVQKFCNDMITLNTKQTTNPEIFCSKTSIQNVYELDIKKYFSTLMYNITKKIFYISLTKSEYLEVAKLINKKGVQLTKAMTNLAHIIFSSLCKHHNINLMYRDTVDSAIVISNLDLPEMINYTSVIAGWNINLDIKVKQLNLVYFNKFRGIRIKIYKDKTIVSNVNISLSYDDIMRLVNDKHATVNDHDLSLIIYLLRQCN